MNDNYYNQIKDLLINNEITKRVKDYSKNKSDLGTYYKIGKLLSEAGKHYGEGIIKKYSMRLTKEFGKGYSARSLKYMRNFYYFQKGQSLIADLSWTHYIQLLSIKNDNEIQYYINVVKSQKLSVRQLKSKIKSKEYERLPIETKNKLINMESIDIKESIPEPILIKNIYSIEKDKISEKVLHKLILEDLDDFLNELGEGYCYIKSEYQIKIGDIYNYIDLLLFNIKYNCYVVIELKVTELKSEHIGQVEKYVNYIDENIKGVNQNKTIGLILVRENNKFVIKYSTDKSIISRMYRIV